MFGLISSLFGGSKATEKVVDTGSYLLKEASSGIDMMFYTDEEKAQAKAQTYAMWLETQKLITQQGTPQAITRRLIAVPWMLMQMGMTTAAVVVKGVSIWLGGEAVELTARNAEKTKEVAEMLSTTLKCSDFSEYILQLQDKQFWVTMAIIGFYFGPAALEMGIAQWKQRAGKK